MFRRMFRNPVFWTVFVMIFLFVSAAGVDWVIKNSRTGTRWDLYSGEELEEMIYYHAVVESVYFPSELFTFEQVHDIVRRRVERERRELIRCRKFLSFC